SRASHLPPLWQLRQSLPSVPLCRSSAWHLGPHSSGVLVNTFPGWHLAHSTPLCPSVRGNRELGPWNSFTARGLVSIMPAILWQSRHLSFEACFWCTFSC